MRTFSRFIALFAAVFACASVPAAQPKKIGEVEVTGDKAIAVRISASSSDLQQLANLAFETHGRYKRVGGGHIYDIKFTSVAPTQVRVDVTRGAGGAAVLSQIVAGTTARHALLRAADLVVEKTNGLNPSLRGYFTARLAFIMATRGSRGDIYVSDLFMGEAKQVTSENALTLTPRWSPDGTRILYTGYFKRNAPDIFLLDPATARKEEFAHFRGTNTGARFSPSGQQVAMVLTGEGSPEIYVSNARGQQVARRTHSRNDAAKSSPAWSPDGGRIVFSMEPGPQLYVIPAGGGTPQKLPGQFSYVTEPDWSVANPNKIACTVRQGGRFQIAVYDLQTSKLQVVSQASFDGVEPAWLADGRHLVYTARDRSTSLLCILDTETGKSTVISPRDRQALQASVWTPAR